MPETQLFLINDASQIGAARRAAMDFARNSGFDETNTEKAAIIVTELASNLLKHANGGQIVVQTNADQTEATIFALDNGAGIRNLGESLRDGFSTAGSAGHGLGAVQRLSDEFDVFTAVNAGTVVRCCLTSQNHVAHPTQNFLVGALALPHPKEVECGDGWAVKQDADVCQMLVADGLGHGEQAAQASHTAIKIFRETSEILPPVDVLKKIHAGLRSTRGAAIAVANLDIGENLVRFAGIGNIAGVVVSDAGQKQMVSHAGIAGFEAKRMREFVYPWMPDALLIMHSDGLQTRWNLDAFPGLHVRHPDLIAALLYRDFTRGNDDVTVIAVKQTPKI